MERFSSCTLQTRRRQIILGQRQSRSIIYPGQMKIESNQSINQQIISKKHLPILLKFKSPESAWRGKSTTGLLKPSFIAYLLQLFAQPHMNHLFSSNRNLETRQAFVCFISWITSNLSLASTQRTTTTSIILRDYNLIYSTTLSHQTLFFYLLAQMVSLLDLFFPRDLFGAQTKSSVPESTQSVQGKNVQEMSCQEGSKDRITHTESSGFHFIEIHQGTAGAMLTLIIVFGLLLCCLSFLWFQFLRRQQLRNLRERFLRGYKNTDRNMDMHDMAGTYRRHQDPESSRISIPELHGGRFPNAILSQRDLHRNLQRNIERSTLRSGSRSHPTPSWSSQYLLLEERQIRRLSGRVPLLDGFQTASARPHLPKT